MAMPSAQWEHIRFEITKRRQEDPVTATRPLQALSRQRIHQSSGDVIRSCALLCAFFGREIRLPWHHGSNLRPDEARAAQYLGQQESALHRWLCEQVAEIVSLDKRARDISVDTYRRATIEGRGRWPDVYFELEGLARFAIEIQLSKPFALEIAARQLFYNREGISLIWLFRDLDAPLPQGFRDVITLQRGNAFTIGDEVLRDSREKRQLLLDCHLETVRGGLSPGDGMGLLWHLALRRYPSAMTELSRRIGEDGLSAGDPFSAAGLNFRAYRQGHPLAACRLPLAACRLPLAACRLPLAAYNAAMSCFNSERSSGIPALAPSCSPRRRC